MMFLNIEGFRVAGQMDVQNHRANGTVLEE